MPIVLLAFGVPVAFAFLAASLACLLTSPGIDVLAERMASSMDSFPLLAVPAFGLVGTIMGSSGTAERLIGFADVLVGHFRHSPIATFRPSIIRGV